MKKPFWKSKTFWGIITFIAPVVLKHFGIEVPDLVTAGGAGLATWGLRTATKEIQPLSKKQ